MFSGWQLGCQFALQIVTKLLQTRSVIFWIFDYANLRWTPCRWDLNSPHISHHLSAGQSETAAPSFSQSEASSWPPELRGRAPEVAARNSRICRLWLKCNHKGWALVGGSSLLAHWLLGLLTFSWGWVSPASDQIRAWTKQVINNYNQHRLK